MINKRWMFIISTLFVFGLLTGCGTEANSKGGSEEEVKEETPKQEEEKFQTFIEMKEENNAVIVNYKVKNVSEESQKLTFSSGLKADFIIYDQQGNKVKQFSDEVSSTQAIQEVVLEKDQELENGFTISDLTNGQYKMEVFLTAKEEQAKVVKDLIVKESKYTKGSGEYVGRMDPHSIEIVVDGETTAFQLSEEAIQQITTIKEGSTVSFLYSDDGIQKTIAKFIIEEE
ncbi:BsuPI-related putative proteinase inhibitor [Neobacillus sp. K501]